MLSKISESELLLWDVLCDPRGFKEIMFDDIDNLIRLDETENINIRAYQETMMSYEYTLAPDPDLDEKQNFKLLENVGTFYNIGSRRFGKTAVSLILEILQSMILLDGWETIYTSFDAIHVRKIMSKLQSVINNHPIYKQYKKVIQQHPQWMIILANGFQIDGINLAINTSKCGDNLVGFHVKKWWGDEWSRVNALAESKRAESESEFGAIEVLCSMTDFTKSTPIGKIFYDPDKKNQICNFSQYVNPTFDDESEKKAIKKYGGKQSNNFKIFVGGDVVEAGVSVFDWERVKKCFEDEKELKTFVIDKKTYHYYESILILERLKNATNVFIAGDYGESISKNEFVLCKIDNKVKFTRVKDIEGLKFKKIEVPTYNEGKLVWEKAELSSHDYNGDMYKFRVFAGNYDVSVTSCHSVMIWTPEGIVQKKSNECKVGDWMIVPKDFHLNNFKHQYINYILPRENHHSEYINRRLKIDEDFAYLLGWAVAEGSRKGNRAYQLAVGINKKQAENLLSIFRKIFNSKFGYVQTFKADKIKKKKFYRLTDMYNLVLSGGKGTADIFENLTGKHSVNKKICDEILNSPKKIKLSFLKGLFEGDGYKKGNGLCLHTISETLAKQTVFLLNSLNYEASISETEPYGDHSKSYQVFYCKEGKRKYFSGVPYEFVYDKKRKDDKLKKLPEYFSKKVSENFNKLNNMEWNFVKIKKIEKFHYNDKVYDFNVKNNKTFVAGCGSVLVHNTAASEINIFFETKEKDATVYKHRYNITLFNLTHKEQSNIYKYIARTLEANFIAIDTGDLGGRACFREIAETVPKENLFAYDGSRKIPIGFEKDDNDKFVLDKNGEPVVKEEFMRQWGVQHFKNLLYDERMRIPSENNSKFHEQVNNVVSTKSGNRTIYEVIADEDHFFDSLVVWACCQWQNEFAQTKPVVEKTHSIGGA